MGSWGYKPLENDVALDLQSNFNDSQNVSILETSLDKVLSLKESQYVEAPDAEEAIAAAYIIKKFSLEKLDRKERNRLNEKINKCAGKILAKSELKDLWFDSPDYGMWSESIKSLIVND